MNSDNTEDTQSDWGIISLFMVKIQKSSLNLDFLKWFSFHERHFIMVMILTIDSVIEIQEVFCSRNLSNNSGMLRQTKLVIFSQTASPLLMNAAGRVSVSPEDITGNTGNNCPLWIWITQQLLSECQTKGQFCHWIEFSRGGNYYVW